MLPVVHRLFVDSWYFVLLKTCGHGRPVQVTMSPEQLVKLGERPAEVVLAHIVLSLQNKV